MRLPEERDAYLLPGLALRPLTPGDVPQMLELQQAVMDALPDQRWYFPSDAEEFLQVTQAGEGFGYWEGDTLWALGELSPGAGRGGHSYARILGLPGEGSYDFHDVMVHPSQRGRGLHTRFLRLFETMARGEGGYGIFATVDPDNQPSWHNFEKAGYRLVVTQPAYDGRARRYYRLDLTAGSGETRL